jgi:hypothetical protein
MNQITSFDRAYQFILAGNATFTLVSIKTGARFTYRVQASKPNQKTGKPDVHFVNVLTGPDNSCSNSYHYVGVIKNNEFRRTNKSRISKEAPSYRAFNWFWFKLIEKGKIPADLALFHEGRCGRCGKALTVPESIETGLGPDCSEMLGVHRVTQGELEGIIAERQMQEMEAQADREETIRDEENKHRARAAMEQRG